jgi:eight-cysteine-cluster-containing protein
MRKLLLPLLFLAACDGAADPSVNEYDDEYTGKADSLSTTSTYYQARPDLRRCVSPLCGGMWVKRVGRQLTKCADGKYATECYVPDVDLGAVLANSDDASTFVQRFEAGRGLVRGHIASKSYDSFGNLGVLIADEAWDAANDAEPIGDAWAVNDNGKRCITYPCYNLHAAQLNRTYDRELSDLDLSGVPNISEEAINEAYELLPKRVLATGTITKKRNAGPAGTATTLNATQFFTPAKSKAKPNPCVPSGCSGEVCSDTPVFTSCIFRPEYDCYKVAECTVQADGQCGWTQDDKLLACLGSL